MCRHYVSAWPRSGAVMNDLVDAASRLFALVTDSTMSVVVSVIGLLLLLGALLAIVTALKGDPTKFPRWLQVVLFITLIFGIGFSVAGPSFALLNFTENAIPKVSTKVAFERLKTNAFTRWLIRLIPYDPAKEPDLAANRPKKLGLDLQSFSFVSSYDELRGLSPGDAVRKAGGLLPDKYRLWAVIFQIPSPDDTVLYPANARGLLQVVRQIENDPTLKIEKPHHQGCGHQGGIESR
jgi:hypothetical protein